ncbi:hypothetical protein [Rhodococcus opacus]|uniref:hypothetical protein n=1 Tax=Rhodococcus opacus TaxID=37919 RepID=UPI0024BABD7A|nr:hypothetical protein [Rhodococcus opacus]MDJ0413812.1 hypothetical protein [Rhodococcus opacus]
MMDALKRSFYWVPAQVYRVGSRVLLVLGFCFWFSGMIVSSASLTDWISPLIASGALVVAVLARQQARRSADAAQTNATISELQEKRRRIGWVIESHPVPRRHVLRNVGTVIATKVELGDKSNFAMLTFVTSRDEPVSIAPGEARAFDAAPMYSAPGIEVSVSWVPEDEEESRTWVEVLEPSSSEASDRGRDQQRKDAQKIREEQRRHDQAKEWRDLLLKLGDAYEDYRSDRESARKKLRVQLLVAALPPGMAREVGYEVDVARDVWGPDEYPLDCQLAAEDRHIVDGVLPQIELVWNMRSLEGTPAYRPADSEVPSSEPRVWWAIHGYVERVKERESGERRLRRSREDQKHFDESQVMIKEALDTFAAGQGNGQPASEDFDL